MKNIEYNEIYKFKNSLFYKFLHMLFDHNLANISSRIRMTRSQVEIANRRVKLMVDILESFVIAGLKYKMYSYPKK
jgi:hypothetical protein